MHPAETRVTMLVEAIRQYASSLRVLEAAQVERGRAYDRMCRLVTICESPINGSGGESSDVHTQSVSSSNAPTATDP